MAIFISTHSLSLAVCNITIYFAINTPLHIDVLFERQSYCKKYRKAKYFDEAIYYVSVINKYFLFNLNVISFDFILIRNT